MCIYRCIWQVKEDGRLDSTELEELRAEGLSRHSAEREAHYSFSSHLRSDQMCRLSFLPKLMATFAIEPDLALNLTAQPAGYDILKQVLSLRHITALGISEGRANEERPHSE